MKLSVIYTIFSVALSALLGYGSYSLCDSDNRLLIAIGTFVMLAVISIVNFALKLPEGRTVVMLRIVAGIFLTIALVSSLIFSLITSGNATYIITNGFIMLVFLMIIVGIAREKQ